MSISKAMVLVYTLHSPTHPIAPEPWAIMPNGVYCPAVATQATDSIQALAPEGARPEFTCRPLDPAVQLPEVRRTLDVVVLNADGTERARYVGGAFFRPLQCVIVQNLAHKFANMLGILVGGQVRLACEAPD